MTALERLIAGLRSSPTLRHSLSGMAKLSDHFQMREEELVVQTA